MPRLCSPYVNVVLVAFLAIVAFYLIAEQRARSIHRAAFLDACGPSSRHYWKCRARTYLSRYYGRGLDLDFRSVFDKRDHLDHAHRRKMFPHASPVTLSYSPYLSRILVLVRHE